MGTGRRKGAVGPHLSVRHRPQLQETGAGRCTLRVDFDLGPAVEAQGYAMAVRFVRLLQQHSSLRVLVAVGSGSVTVAVGFSYHTELELARLYDHVVWLLELSGRATA